MVCSRRFATASKREEINQKVAVKMLGSGRKYFCQACGKPAGTVNGGTKRHCKDHTPLPNCHSLTDNWGNKGNRGNVGKT